jgi:DNA-binding response OmpR family regulator
MWLESVVGSGSTFGFSLPARDGVAPAGSAPTVGEVVIIEDDRPSLDLLTAYLVAAAVGVTPARDGQSGLEAVRRVRPDAVLLDIRLPGMDGWSVLQALKADDETRQVPVIVVSIVDERARGVELGAAAYLVKPVRRSDVLTAIRGVGVPAGEPAGGQAEVTAT